MFGIKTKINSIESHIYNYIRNHLKQDKNYIQIISYEDVDSWILGKFAKKMQSELINMGKKATIATTGNFKAFIGHHIAYYDAHKKWSPIETFMITHLDKKWKFEHVRRILKIYDMGICMSEETMSKLVNLGMPSSRLSYVNPAQDGNITPRPIVIGLSGRTYQDGRKNAKAIVDIFHQLPKNGFQLKIMGNGWTPYVNQLLSEGYNVCYYKDFDYESYTKKFMPSLDFFLYYSCDEGCMAFLDAVAAGVKTIVTYQGYHIDLRDAIDYPISGPDEVAPILLQEYEKKKIRSRRVSTWNWHEYTQRHLLIWDYLTQKKFSIKLKSEIEKYLREYKENNSEIVNILTSDNRPSIDCISTFLSRDRQHDYPKLSSFLKNSLTIFYPKHDIRI